MRNKKYIRYSSRVFAFVMSAVLASGMPVSAQAAAKKEKQKEKIRRRPCMSMLTLRVKQSR